MKSVNIDKRTSGSIAGYDTVTQVTLISDVVTFDNNVGKFTIPTVTSSMSADKAVEVVIPKKSTQNLINRDNMGTSKILTTNYIELEIPKHLFYIENIKIVPNTTHGGEDNCIKTCNPIAMIQYNTYVKGRQFIVTYTKLNKENPVIIGVMPND